MELANEMRAHNVERNVHTYTALMNVCIKCGKCPLAMDTYHHMRQARLSLTIEYPVSSLLSCQMYLLGSAWLWVCLLFLHSHTLVCTHACARGCRESFPLRCGSTGQVRCGQSWPAWIPDPPEISRQNSPEDEPRGFWY